MTRACGDCSLCCFLIPVRELNKPANKRCVHQRFGKGCMNYARRPASCALWTCAWLADPDATELRRPDRARYVIDVVPDAIKVKDSEGKETAMEVIRVWVDPKHPDAHRDPALRAYLQRRGAAEGRPALICCGSDAMVLIPPAMNVDNEWVECRSDLRLTSDDEAARLRALAREPSNAA